VIEFAGFVLTLFIVWMNAPVFREMTFKQVVINALTHFLVGLYVIAIVAYTIHNAGK